MMKNSSENQIGPARNDGGQRFVAVARRARSVPLVLQDARDQFADVRFVVNDQDVGCHGIVRPAQTNLPIWALLGHRRRLRIR